VKLSERTSIGMIASLGAATSVGTTASSIGISGVPAPSDAACIAPTCALGDEINHLHALRLTQPMHTADTLFEYRGIPGQIHVDDGCCRMLQIQTDAAGIRG